MMWLRSPFSRLRNNGSLDMQISVDSSDVGAGHLINTGFYHVRSNNRTISLFQKWYDMRLN
ncbi:putative nucleotide-diphospho-sugar transferase, partial [Pseudomonas poae]|uniref:putative nucleotide-diphospho-sugar transferase n=1 Tax=Pseudomonas poae TaxID=200451 RepID=UPI0034D596F7